jgi:hypothetical protein
MGLFKYIVSGTESGCREFFESLDHCYDKEIEFEEGTADDYIIWISGQRKYMLALWDIEAISRRLRLDVKGSCEIEDREPEEEPGTTFRYNCGKYVAENFSDDERVYLDPDQYCWD